MPDALAPRDITRHAFGWSSHARERLWQRYRIDLTPGVAAAILGQVLAAAWPEAPLAPAPPPAAFIRRDGASRAWWWVRLEDQDVVAVIELRPAPTIITFMPRERRYG